MKGMKLVPIDVSPMRPWIQNEVGLRDHLHGLTTKDHMVMGISADVSVHRT